jgi:transposase
VWLKKYPDGRSAEAISFRALNQLNLKTSRTWAIKENFTQFWSYSYKGAAKRCFDAWSANAMPSRLEPIKKVVKMLRRHEAGCSTTANSQLRSATSILFASASSEGGLTK